jgi:hypothetical protein
MWCLCTDVPKNQPIPSIGYMNNGELFMWVNIYLRSELFWVVMQYMVNPA